VKKYRWNTAAPCGAKSSHRPSCRAGMPKNRRTRLPSCTGVVIGPGRRPCHPRQHRSALLEPIRFFSMGGVPTRRGNGESGRSYAGRFVMAKRNQKMEGVAEFNPTGRKGRLQAPSCARSGNKDPLPRACAVAKFSTPSTRTGARYSFRMRVKVGELRAIQPSCRPCRVTAARAASSPFGISRKFSIGARRKSRPEPQRNAAIRARQISPTRAGHIAPIVLSSIHAAAYSRRSRTRGL